MTDLEKQNEEIEALSSIYDTDWSSEGETSGARAFKANINEGGNCTTMYISLPTNYPSSSPPEYQISAPNLKKHHKQALILALDEIYLENIGEPVIYQFIEKVREFLSDLNSASADDPSLEIHTEISESNINQTFLENADLRVPTITHGNLIQDRKSGFQGHAATVTSELEVRTVLSALMGNRKIAQAKHNIVAYRFICPKRGTLVQDCDDDGESHAGSRLLHLLNILEADNVVVVVTRWYGGIHLGPDRFRHINNAGRQALELAGFIKNKK